MVKLVYTNEDELQHYFHFVSGANPSGDFLPLTEEEVKYRDELFAKFKGNAYTLATSLTPEQEAKLIADETEHQRIKAELDKPLNLSENTKSKLRGMFADLGF